MFFRGLAMPLPVPVIEDLHKMPAPLRSLNGDEQFTLGDLHGNTLKFIHFLIKEGVMILDRGEADYQTFMSIYYKDPKALKIDDLLEIAVIIECAKYNPCGLIRLLGDEQADRGSNDYYTLLVLNQLKKNNIRFEIILSNHGVVALSNYEDRARAAKSGIIKSNIAKGYVNSAENLWYLVNKRLISSTELDDLIDNVYRPAVCLLGYCAILGY